MPIERADKKKSTAARRARSPQDFTFRPRSAPPDEGPPLKVKDRRLKARRGPLRAAMDVAGPAPCPGGNPAENLPPLLIIGVVRSHRGRGRVLGPDGPVVPIRSILWCPIKPPERASLPFQKLQT